MLLQQKNNNHINHDNTVNINHANNNLPNNHNPHNIMRSSVRQWRLFFRGMQAVLLRRRRSQRRQGRVLVVGGVLLR